MKIDIMTLFPEMINAVMRESIIGRAQDRGVVEVKATNIRDYALDKHHKADDAPYGGGRGQVMLAEPLYLCHQALSAGSGRDWRIGPFKKEQYHTAKDDPMEDILASAQQLGVDISIEN